MKNKIALRVNRLNSQIIAGSRGGLMIVFIRSYSISKDSRLQKYINLCKNNNIPVKIIGWDKDATEDNNNDCNTIYYKGNFAIGQQWKNLLHIIKWWIFIFSNIFTIKKKHKIKAIHSVDLDCGIIGYILSKIIKSKHIYDIYDVFSANRNMKGKIKNIVNLIERYISRNSEYFIMPESFRFEQLGIDKSDKKYSNFVEIENVPDIIEEHAPSPKNNITFVYAGSLEPKHRGIENLLEVISEYPNIKLLIAGIGPLSKLCSTYANKFNNIEFFGGLKPNEVYMLESKGNIIVGMYYKTRDNHLFASPNKYYEHLALGKAMLTTEGTPPGIKVEALRTGFSIGEEKYDIRNLIDMLIDDNKILDIFSQNAKKIWSDKYKDYNSNYFNKTYLHMVK
ncbi:glycosyltransferase [Morganella morganii]|uniref:glycosyltransferase n=1 Tax=Morganella morganii TaxID=582 RepID=UPI0034D596E9